MRYLVTGSGGQLAREFIRTFEAGAVPFSAPAEAQCDITDAASVEHAVSSCRPDVILNCAAYNLVDKAEEEPDAAMRVNAAGPRHLAESASRHGARLVHFSTDYVFDGEKREGLYVEQDEALPANAYGRSKRAGEIAVQEALPGRSLVLRLSWLYGAGVQNFIHKFLERVERGAPLAATCDEFSVPTWTGTVVDVTLAAVEQGLSGLFHVAGRGYCSRFEWAREILRVRRVERFVRPVTRDTFGLPARRPMFSAMSSEAVERALGMRIDPWEDSLAEFMNKEQLK